ncbi:type VII secretion target [Gordonia jacobaea]|uniref:type VII secretion target n=1 Tax=Gordonia jacobaea TaxID=122202 RepID=UPI003D75F24F
MTDLTSYRTSLDTAALETAALETAALDAYAGTQRTAGHRVAAHATAGRTDLAALTPTFGVIGADFLAALSATMQARAERLDAIAVAHDRIGTNTTTAAVAYSDADTANASDMGLRLP